MPFVKFTVPFPPRMSPDVDRALQHNLTWLAAQGFHFTPAHLDYYCRQLPAETCALSLPTARGTGLDLTLDALSWTGLFDDHIERLTAKAPEQGHELCQELIRMTWEAPGYAAELDSPFTVSWADVWRREADGMSPVWQRRTADHWRAYLESYVVELDDRVRGTVPTLDAYLTVRRSSMFIVPWSDFIERAGGYEIPEQAFQCADMQELRTALTDHCICVNDTFSVEKEETFGDTHNMILILEREKGLSRPAAVEYMVALANEKLTTFLALKERVLHEKASLPERDQHAVGSYVQGLAHLMVANTMVHYLSARYDASMTAYRLL